MDDDRTTAQDVARDFPALDRQDEDQLLPQLVAHLREHRTKLRQEWASRIQDAHLLHAMTPQEMAAETTSVYDNYVEVLETGSVEALQRYARDLSERIIPRGVETHEVVGIVLLLRDVLARSLFEKYQGSFGLLNRVLDSERARQLTEQLLTAIRTHRAKVVVVDITGVPDVDEAVANHLVQTVDASRLMGASVIITGLSPEIAQTLVTIGVDLTKMDTIGDLQGGLEEAERLLGYTVIRESGMASP